MNQTSIYVPTPRKLAIILSGGGARGAYEVGILSYVFTELARLRGAPPRVDILCGTSVGAINACFLAAHLSDPALGMRRLTDLWTRLALPQVLGFGLRQAFSIPRILTGGGDAVGFFDVKPMADLVTKEIPWRAISRELRRGHLQTLSLSTTEVSSGRTVIFMQTGPEGALPTTCPPRTLIRAARITPAHALASAAIPFLFPPVKIGRELYVDGSLRQNTPIAPALRLGATHVFAIGLSRDTQSGDVPTAPSSGAPGAAFLLGKVMNAFLLDHINTDLELLSRLNDVLEDGVHTYGSRFLNDLSQAARARGGQGYRPVRSLAIRPSEDIGRMAAEHVRSGNLSASRITRRLLGMLDVGVGTESDLSSYLLFDGPFARKLIELGRADAAARREEMLSFFGSPSEDGEPPPKGSEEDLSSDKWSVQPFSD